MLKLSVIRNNKYSTSRHILRLLIYLHKFVNNVKCVGIIYEAYNKFDISKHNYWILYNRFCKLFYLILFLCKDNNQFCFCVKIKSPNAHECEIVTQIMRHRLSHKKRIYTKIAVYSSSLAFQNFIFEKHDFRRNIYKYFLLNVHVPRKGEERGCIGSWWGNRREGDHWGDLGVDGWIILGWISRRWDVGIWTELGWPRIETGGGRLWVR